MNGEFQEWLKVISKPSEILLVEDDELLCELIANYVVDYNCTMRCVHSGQAAIDILDTMKFDLVILDLSLPGKDGFDVLRSIKMRDLGIPVVVLSGYITEEAIQRVRDYGLVVFVVKPSGMTQLMKVFGVKRLTKRASSSPFLP